MTTPTTDSVHSRHGCLRATDMTLPTRPQNNSRFANHKCAAVVYRVPLDRCVQDHRGTERHRRRDVTTALYLVGYQRKDNISLDICQYQRFATRVLHNWSSRFLNWPSRAAVLPRGTRAQSAIVTSGHIPIQIARMSDTRELILHICGGSRSSGLTPSLYQVQLYRVLTTVLTAAHCPSWTLIYVVDMLPAQHVACLLLLPELAVCLSGPFGIEGTHSSILH